MKWTWDERVAVLGVDEVIRGVDAGLERRSGAYRAEEQRQLLRWIVSDERRAGWGWAEGWTTQAASAAVVLGWAWCVD